MLRFALFVCLAALTAPQWRPPVPTNLQVLPKDTAPGDVIRVMRTYTMGLGVRCEHCHAGEGNDLSKFDFASDAKPAKVTARRMMRMAREINDTLLAGFPEGRAAGTSAVTCYSCHRGELKPLTARPQQPERQ